MKRALIGLIILAALVAACTPTQPTEIPVGDPADGAIYIDGADLLIMESYPVQVALSITGNLPTPCHEWRYQYEIQDFGDEKRVDVTIFSVADPEAVCVQMLLPFEERISFDLQNAPEGAYKVYLNGELVGEFSYPA